MLPPTGLTAAVGFCQQWRPGPCCLQRGALQGGFLFLPLPDLQLYLMSVNLRVTPLAGGPGKQESWSGSWPPMITQ